RAGVQPTARIVGIDAAADLQSSGIGGQGLARRGFVAGSEHNDVASFETVALVKLRIERRGLFGDKIRAQRRRIVAPGAADDLLHFAFVKIDARSEHANMLTRRVRRVECGSETLERV